MGWTRASLIAQDVANALVWRLHADTYERLDTNERLDTYVVGARRQTDVFDRAWARRVALPHDDYGTQALLIAPLQYTDDQFTSMAGPEAAVTAIICFCELIGPPLYCSRDAAEAARGTAARHATLLRGDALPRGVPRKRRGVLRVKGTEETVQGSAALLRATDGQEAGLPYEERQHGDAVAALACLLACPSMDADTIREVARLRGVELRQQQGAVSTRHLAAAMERAASDLRDERELIILCPFKRHHEEQHEGTCHAGGAGGPPGATAGHRARDGSRPAAGPGEGGAHEGPRAQHGGGKAAQVAPGRRSCLDWSKSLSHMADHGECTVPVAAFRSFVGALHDVLKATGGGHYRMKGLYSPLAPGGEIDEGPGTKVRLRRQMAARLTAWQAVLSNRAGASMLAHASAAAPDDTSLVWEIGGDAASEGGTIERLGAFWYGTWWNVPLCSVKGLADLHITCLELIELGLGLVTVGPWLARAARLRLVSDAMAAVLTLRARKESGELAKQEARSRALIAVHEVILAQPEWVELHRPAGRVKVAQRYDETLLLEDAASRGQTHVIQEVCAALGLQQRKLDLLPPRSKEYLRWAVCAARKAAAAEPVVAPTGAAQRACERRFAASTRRLDSSYWVKWREWCARIGTPPLRTNTAANTGVMPHLHEREVVIALGAFIMAFVAENSQYKVESMLARLWGVARRHKRVGLTFVSLSLSTVVMAADGLVQKHIDAHGADSLLACSKEPFATEELVAILSLPRAGHLAVGDNLEWQGVRVMITLYCTMGPRKDAIALDRGEVFGPRKLSLWHITWRLKCLLQRAPTVHILRAIVPGDVLYVTPCPCKNDPTGTKYGNGPVPSAYHPTRPINLEREAARYEIMRHVPPAERKQARLVLGPGGKSWAKAAGLDAFFKELIVHVAAPERARQLSMHSFRVWLACSLLAAGATPEQIMLLLRWSSDSARKLYARLGER
ncbi:MAG: hypothetical protein SGPRY_002180, partial [Prymnesium sp.]